MDCRASKSAGDHGFLPLNLGFQSMKFSLPPIQGGRTARVFWLRSTGQVLASRRKWLSVFPCYQYGAYVEYVWLVVWNMNFMTSPIAGMMIQSDFHIFQRDWNHQPDVKYQSKTWPSFRATKTSHVSRATWSWKSKAVNLQLGMVSISPISGKSVEVVEMVWSLGFTTSLLHYFYIRTSSVGHFLVFCFLVRSHISSVSAASVALRSCLSSHSWWMSHCLHPCHGHHLNRYFFTFVPVLFWPTNQLSVPQHWNRQP